MKDKSLRKFDAAQDSVKLVRDNLPDSYQQFQEMSQLERDGIYKNIEFAIQNVLDICAIILKQEDLRVPASDENMLEELQEAKVLSQDVIEIITTMKGFRNYLVHKYGEVSDKVAYQDIKEGLGDFEQVFAEIKNYISS